MAQTVQGLLKCYLGTLINTAKKLAVPISGLAIPDREDGRAITKQCESV